MKFDAVPTSQASRAESAMPRPGSGFSLEERALEARRGGGGTEAIAILQCTTPTQCQSDDVRSEAVEQSVTYPVQTFWTGVAEAWKGTLKLCRAVPRSMG